MVAPSEGKNKVLNTNNNFQLLDVNSDLKKFTTKDKNIIEYFSNQIISHVKCTLFNDLIYFGNQIFDLFMLPWPRSLFVIK
jgi:hypothetical protein